MVKQAVGILASIVAVGVVGLSLAVLVRLAWSSSNGYHFPAPNPSSEPDKALRKA